MKTEYKKLAKEMSELIVGIDELSTNCVTLNPTQCAFGEDAKSKKIHIKANIGGPINIDQYAEANPKILFLLKESYISADLFDKGDRGGHNQSEEYRDTPYPTGNTTWDRMVEAVAGIVSPDENLSNEQMKSIFNKHACVINVNHFPGVAIGGTDSNNTIGEWSKINYDFICRQISIYKPDVIIGGHTLNSIFENEGLKFHPNMIKVDFNILGYNFRKEDNGIVDSCDYYYYFNKDVVMINAYHPSSRTAFVKDTINTYFEAKKIKLL